MGNMKGFIGIKWLIYLPFLIFWLIELKKLLTCTIYNIAYCEENLL